jgi:uncharacterized Zn finger protein
MNKVKFKKNIVKTKLAWTDWINPVMDNYLLKCCDCGLVHKMQFRVHFTTKWKNKKLATLLKDTNFQVEFRARRIK